MTDEILGGTSGGGRGERATGTPNTIYDLSSVLFHALKGGASYDTYIEDAEREGDQALSDFFRRVRDEDSMRADEAQQLLAERTPTAGRTGETPPAVGQEEGPLGRQERAPLGREDRLPVEERASLGREDPLPGEERASLGREDRLPGEERAPLVREDRLPEEERRSKTENTEKEESFLDKAKRKLEGL